MNDLDVLRRILGGVVRRRDGQQWLSTQIGGLSVAIVRRVLQGGHLIELRVPTKHTRELDASYVSSSHWVLGGDVAAVPKLQHGFVFAGCPGGILSAASTSRPSVEAIVSTLWELAHWARQKWHPVDGEWSWDDYARWIEEQRRERRRRWFARGALAVSVALIVVGLVRR